MWVILLDGPHTGERRFLRADIASILIRDGRARRCETSPYADPEPTPEVTADGRSGSNDSAGERAPANDGSESLVPNRLRRHDAGPSDRGSHRRRAKVR